MSVYAVRDALLEAERVIAFTGAGVSVASGIPDFRSAEGLWARYPVEDYATIDAFLADPERFWGFWGELRALCGGAAPNPAHQALARLEELGRLHQVITQNIDGLHHRAGNRDVVSVHGVPDRVVCLRCRTRAPFDPDAVGPVPTCADCGDVLKPDVVLFGEELPQAEIERAFALAASCDVCLVVGTSAVVYPAAAVPELVASRGATVAQFDLESTGLTHQGRVRHFVAGPAEETLPRLVALLEAALGPM